MDYKKYQKFVNKYADEAIKMGGGTTEGAYEYLNNKRSQSVLFGSAERTRAIRDLRKHFATYKKQPLWVVMDTLDIVLHMHSLDPGTHQ
jgi:hypothetical protein